MAALKPLLLCLALCLPQAGRALDERQELAAQRQRIEAAHAAAQKACAPRFNVTACEEEARRERSAALKPLLACEQVLAAEQRQARAQAQRERVQAKQESFAGEDGRRMQRSVQSESAAAALAPAPAPAPKPARVDAQARDHAVKAEIARSERAAERRRQQAAQREQEAQARRDSAQRRQQKQQEEAGASKKSAKPATHLPVPSAAEIAALPAKPPASAAKP